MMQQQLQQAIAQQQYAMAVAKAQKAQAKYRGPTRQRPEAAIRSRL